MEHTTTNRAANSLSLEYECSTQDSQAALNGEGSAGVNTNESKDSAVTAAGAVESSTGSGTANDEGGSGTAPLTADTMAAVVDGGATPSTPGTTNSAEVKEENTVQDDSYPYLLGTSDIARSVQKGENGVEVISPSEEAGAPQADSADISSPKQQADVLLRCLEAKEPWSHRRVVDALLSFVGEDLTTLKLCLLQGALPWFSVLGSSHAVLLGLFQGLMAMRS